MGLTLEGLLLRIKHRKLVVALTPILVGGALTVSFVVRPYLYSFSRAGTDQTELTRKAGVVNDILVAEKRLSQLRAHLGAIGERSKIIEEINLLASKAQLTISSVTPEEKTSLGFYLEKMVLRIDAEGNYHQLASFISKIENLEAFAKILSVDIDVESPENFALSTRTVGVNTNGSVKSGQLRSYKMTVNIGFFAAQKGAL